MRWSSMGLFATPLIKIELSELLAAKQFFYEKLQIPGRKDKDLKHFHSGENVFELYSELAPLKSRLEEAGRFVYQDLLNHQAEGKMLITSAWFNLCGVGASQLSHSHSNSLLSGTCYLNVDEQSTIEFYHPLTSNSLHAELYDEADNRSNEHGLSYHKRTVSVPVTNGDCLFWPSQLKHGYQNNQTPDRLSLSFNMMPSQFNATYQVSA